MRRGTDGYVNDTAELLQFCHAGEKTMTPPADLIECANCQRWFTGASLDDVFYHATCACSRDLPAAADAAPLVTD